MSYTFRPAVRENTPLIIGIGGPTKSGKTYSALRIATGLANGGTIAMLNAEGPRGHQYADKFTYVACDLTPPFRPTSYTEALQAARAIPPAVVIIDSASHMHDGPGGVLEWHEQELDRMAGTDYKKRERATFAAWVQPKAAENQFIYEMLGMRIPVILCFRAKEKIKLVRGQEPIELGWQPIAGERVAFETIFTLMLPPHSKGVPDLEISELREPFDTLIPKGKPIDEDLGRALAAWSRGGGARPAASPAADGERATALKDVTDALVTYQLGGNAPEQTKKRGDALEAAFGVRQWKAVEALGTEALRAGLAKLQRAFAPPPAQAAQGDEGPATRALLDDEGAAIDEARAIAWTLLQDAAGDRALELLQLVTRDFGDEHTDLDGCTAEDFAKIAQLGASALQLLVAQLPARNGGRKSA